MKHLGGPDGRTGYERLFGKPPREEGLELGEVVLWRKPKQEWTAHKQEQGQINGLERAISHAEVQGTGL